MLAVKIVDNPRMAELLIDPMRRTILSLLADKAMTETQLAGALGLTESAVGHHLKTLSEVELVRLVKKEPESHGILQKFYRASALCFVIDFRKLPQEVSRYFFSVNIERIRGAICALYIVQKWKNHLSSHEIEILAELLAGTLIEVAENYKDSTVSMDRETFTVKLYNEALLKMLNKKTKEIQRLQKALKSRNEKMKVGKIEKR